MPKAKGIAKLSEEVLSWYIGTAEQGYAVAQYNLCVIYEQGTEDPAGHPEAVQCYRLAARNGDKDAQKGLKTIERNHLRATDTESKKVSQRKMERRKKRQGTNPAERCPPTIDL